VGLGGLEPDETDDGGVKGRYAVAGGSLGRSGGLLAIPISRSYNEFISSSAVNIDSG